MEGRTGLGSSGFAIRLERVVVMDQGALAGGFLSLRVCRIILREKERSGLPVRAKKLTSFYDVYSALLDIKRPKSSF